jgi:hypothetical protein
MMEGFLFGTLFVTFTIGISYVIGEYLDGKDYRQKH